jgi:hypothetical protein
VRKIPGPHPTNVELTLRARFIQIATSASGEDGCKNLYALDSDGVLWQWCAGDHDFRPGWEVVPDCRGEERRRPSKTESG